MSPLGPDLYLDLDPRFPHCELFDSRLFVAGFTATASTKARAAIHGIFQTIGIICIDTLLKCQMEYQIPRYSLIGLNRCHLCEDKIDLVLASTHLMSCCPDMRVPEQNSITPA
ncbi:hypothetical protein H112_04546 [Trichophyton rubrum D6]|uniref:Uncharacterized protein n=3 Tax=Trichophyton TaxID=5550 RepID=A0A080WMV7_TRIRC|nr:uncharacterized protein TERG_12132 [Trichophyton rubrum CBS 118892]EZF22629.1 hypothetical protein H100_04553 [Trichophyton rubrum MR850]EZF41748.1 hypothetical protein H102_04540 [Trichophyton rubrum CBS 100081]EZF52345.1 hypothetical protein H103_04548 [Trichophyton rubrum CBS 288.86]EZF62929.1 hypothetical protein H104_04536 [Trichophyton rubrum CBS 289.86]EZF73501.1 hypothetical protein H105_04563 [Trichophyton soudanense CBS 452.61]EZF84254.1 hypothetical protein H110_04540 [Trichophy